MVSKVTIFLFLAVCMLVCVASQAKECAERCIGLYQPVCARCHGKHVTFSNNCMLHLHNCKKNDCVYVRDGDCNLQVTM